MRHESWNCWRMRHAFGCVYISFLWLMFFELPWNMLHWPDMVSFLLKQVPNLGSSYHPEPASPSKCFSMISMHSLGCLPSNSDHLRIISCFVRWQLLTAGNRDNQMYSSLIRKKNTSFAPLHIFFMFHGVVEHDAMTSQLYTSSSTKTPNLTQRSHAFFPPTK